jgi:hypothetical protein
MDMRKRESDRARPIGGMGGHRRCTVLQDPAAAGVNSLGGPPNDSNNQHELIAP